MHSLKSGAHARVHVIAEPAARPHSLGWMLAPLVSFGIAIAAIVLGMR